MLSALADLPTLGRAAEPIAVLAHVDAHRVGVGLRYGVGDEVAHRAGDVAVVMHDLGGIAALQAAAGWTERVAGLVAINSFGWRPSGLMFKAMLLTMGSSIMREFDTATNLLPLASSSRFGVGRHWDRTTRKAFRRGMTRPGRRSFHRYMRSARKHDYTNIDAAVANLAALPVLTVFGQRNDPLKFQPKWATRFAEIEHVTIPKGYHFPMCDDPKLVGRSISAWHARTIG